MTAIREDHPFRIKIITGPFGTGKVNKNPKGRFLKILFLAPTGAQGVKMLCMRA